MKTRDLTQEILDRACLIYSKHAGVPAKIDINDPKLKRGLESGLGADWDFGSKAEFGTRLHIKVRWNNDIFFSLETRDSEIGEEARKFVRKMRIRIIKEWRRSGIPVWKVPVMVR